MVSQFNWAKNYDSNHGERKFGYNTDVGTGWETIWSVGGLYVFPTAEDSCVVASSGNDNSSGSGARTIRIFYLDGSYTEKTTDVTLNGGNVTTSVSDIFRINRALVLTAGTTRGRNANNINITHTSTGDTLARIPADEGVTKQCVYTVPKRTGAWLVDVTFSSDGNKDMDVRGISSIGTGPSIALGDLFGINGFVDVDLKWPQYLAPTTDFELQAIVATTAVKATGALQFRLASG